MKGGGPGLLFVYNADSGLFNTLADIGHKIVAPATYECHLCELTHGWLSMRAAWKELAARLGVDIEYLHRDQFLAAWGDPGCGFPAIFRRADEGAPVVCATPEQIGACADLDALVTLVTGDCLDG